MCSNGYKRGLFLVCFAWVLSVENFVYRGISYPKYPKKSAILRISSTIFLHKSSIVGYVKAYRNTCQLVRPQIFYLICIGSTVNSITALQNELRRQHCMSMVYIKHNLIKKVGTLQQRLTNVKNWCGLTETVMTFKSTSFL